MSAVRLGAGRGSPPDSEPADRPPAGPLPAGAPPAGLLTDGLRTYRLVGADGRSYAWAVPGAWGGHRRGRIYGRLDCAAAVRALARGGYVRDRVFFADEATAQAAGYRPCAVCCPERYRAWRRGSSAG